MTATPGTAQSTDLIFSYSRAVPGQVAAAGGTFLLAASLTRRQPAFSRVFLVVGTMTLIAAGLLWTGGS